MAAAREGTPTTMRSPIARICLAALVGAVAVAGCSGAPKQQSEVQQGQANSSGVHLSPDPAFAASQISVVFDDPWIDPAKCQFLWRRDGVVIEGAKTSSLDPTQFSKGQRISVVVSVADSAGANKTELTARVEVVNSPPKVFGATLLMTATTGTAEIHANVRSTDPDADPVTYDYRWFKNDAPLGGESGPSLAVNKLERGDRVVVEVIASDGQSSSPPFLGEALTIENRPPQFTSQPRAPRATDAEYRYQVVAVDLDGDQLRYELVNAPEGMTVDPTGVVVWRLPAQTERRGDHAVRIKVTDSKGGEAVQEFSIHLTPPQTPAQSPG